jgi:transposase
MSEAAGIDSVFLERAMPKPYSVDLRARVIEDVETGASRREAAERYGISPSVVVIWVQRFEETGSVAAKPSGGSTSPLEQHAEFLLDLIVDQPDLTLDEIVAAMHKRRIAGSRSAVWRFFARRNISFKKNSVRGGAEACGRSPRTPALDARARQRGARPRSRTIAVVVQVSSMNTNGAVMPRCRRPPTKVIVFQCPCGA